VYTAAAPEGIRIIYDLLAAALDEVAGIQLNAGKVRVWSRAGVQLAGMDGFGHRCLEPGPGSINVLDAPIGTDAFVQDRVETLRPR